MDYLNEIEEVKNKLKAAGFNDEDLNQLLDLAVDDAIDTALNDLQSKEPEVVAKISQNMEGEITKENAMQKLNDLFTGVYGEEAPSKKQELILNYLKKSLDQIDKVKDLLNRYKAGDPSAVAAMAAQEGNPDVQKILEE